MLASPPLHDEVAMAKGPALTGHIIKLEITLKRTDPPIWRGLLVPAHMTLGDLHYVIQRAMGWDNEHLHEFRVGKTTYGESGPGVRALDPDGVTLGDVQRKGIRNFIYIYDFGDSWEHVCAMKGTAPRVEGQHYPACIAGARACPPEDCGGTWRYADLLTAFADPEDPGHAYAVEWLGDKFDPEAFSAEAVNAQFAAQARRLAPAGR